MNQFEYKFDLWGKGVILPLNKQTNMNQFTENSYTYLYSSSLTSLAWFSLQIVSVNPWSQCVLASVSWLWFHAKLAIFTHFCAFCTLLCILFIFVHYSHFCVFCVLWFRRINRTSKRPWSCLEDHCRHLEGCEGSYKCLGGPRTPGGPLGVLERPGGWPFGWPLGMTLGGDPWGWPLGVSLIGNADAFKLKIENLTCIVLHYIWVWPQVKQTHKQNKKFKIIQT